jgi:DNA (cytosine-5)-methyltransferase 1
VNYYNDFDQHSVAWLKQLIADGLIPDGHVDGRSIKEVQPSDLQDYDQCHFFAGIAGWPLAMQLAGRGDERNLWTGSCPCQPYSSAGKQKGDADERNLWPEFFRLIRECRPDVVFGEQVESAIRHGWLDGIQRDLEGEDYAVGHCVLGAHSVGAPHIRQRLFWVAESNGERFSSEPISELHDAEYHACHGDVQRGGKHGLQPQVSVACRLADSENSDGRRASGAEDSGQRRPEAGGSDSWGDYDLVACRDSKVRRIERGTFPLVARLPGDVVPSGDPSLSYVQATTEARTWRLKGYGNAIVPQLAAEFIEAFYKETA